MGALLTVAAGGTIGVDHPLEAHDDFNKPQHAQAWARTGMVCGSSTERATLTPQLAELVERSDVFHFFFDSHPARDSSTE